MTTHVKGAFQRASHKSTKRGGSELPHFALRLSIAHIAGALGLEKSHLRRVLNGERESIETLKAYHDFCTGYAKLKAATPKRKTPKA